MGVRGVSRVFAARRLATLTGAVVALALLAALPSGVADAAALQFGPSSFSFDVVGQDGSIDGQAGGHPEELTVRIALNSEPQIGPEGNLIETSVQGVRDVVIDLPLGFLAGAQATPKCTFVALEGAGCDPDTAVGHVLTEPAGEVSVDSPVYNMVPEQGTPAEFGYLDKVGNTHALYASVAPSTAGYVLRITAPELPQVPLTNFSVTFYGDPAAKDGGAGAPLALLTNPSDCSGGPLRSTVYMDSWQDPGAWSEGGRLLAAPTGTRALPLLTSPGWVQASAESPAVTGCDALAFDPELSAQPTTNVADSPTGLELELRSPQSEAAEADATPPLRSAVVTLPEGIALDPSAGDGLQACSVAQVGWLGPDGPNGEQLPNRGLTNFTAQAPACPEGSKVGSLELTTPLFAGVLSGAVYLAAQDENPFGSALAAYAVVEDATTGVVLKLPAELRADPRSGRLTVVLAESPQLPFSDLKLSFFGGPRALLATPQSCGTFTTTSELAPFSAPESGPAASPFDSFQIDEGCVSGFAPSFVAGVTNLQAGAYSPFEVSFARADTDQELAGWSVSLPPGLLADVGAVPLCAEANANAGTCPEASRVGTVLVGAGPGPNPLFMSGKAYLTGPYNGGPFGLSVVVPVIAGPLNLGTVVVRQSLRIGGGRAPDNAQITDVSNPFPTVLDTTGANGQTDGIPIRLRRVDIVFERPGGAPFMFNPTDCAKLPLTGSVASAQGASAAVSSPFHVTNCKGLKFTPKLTALTRANGQFAGHGASLHVAITTGASGSTSPSSSTSPSTPGTITTQANMRSLKLDLPQRLPARLQTIQKACPEKTFAQNPAACPKAAVVGLATVATPILGVPMTGPAYLVSKNGTGTSHPGESKTEREEAAFPDLVLVLQGEGVRIDLTGALFVSVKNITSVAFRSIPDVPIRRLDLILPEGKTSILAASSRLCTKRPLTMFTAVTGQDGARVKPIVRVGVEGCRKHKQPKRRRRQQAQQAGVWASSLARLAEDGLLERVTHGVYRIRGAAEPDHLQLRAAWLALDPGEPAWARVGSPGVALVSHASAASLYGVGDLRADVHEFTLPVRRQTRRRDVRLHRGHVPENQRIVLKGLPTTRAGRMIADLLGDHVEPASVAQITAGVVHRVLDYPGSVAECIAPYAARFGFLRGDGTALLDHLLTLANYSDREAMVALARDDEH